MWDMGLELVEIVLQVEETFGVIVVRDDAFQIKTVGDLYQYIVARRVEQRQQGCPTARAFRDIRRVLTETTSMPKQAIRPSTELATLLPLRSRRRVWKKLDKKLPGQIPVSCLPYRLGPKLAGLCVVAGLVGTVTIAPHIGIGHAVVLGMTASLATVLLFSLVSFPFAVTFPRGVVTVGDLAVASLPPDCEQVLKREMTDEEIWEKLREIVAETLGLKAEDITPSARFVEDLGAG
jgi:acyl carrier protein